MLDICSNPHVCLGVFTKCLPQCANVCVCTYACATSRAMVPNLLVLTYDLFPWKQKKSLATACAVCLQNAWQVAVPRVHCACVCVCTCA